MQKRILFICGSIATMRMATPDAEPVPVDSRSR